MLDSRIAESGRYPADPLRLGEGRAQASRGAKEVQQEFLQRDPIWDRASEFPEVNADVQNFWLEANSSLRFNWARLDESFQYFITKVYDQRLTLQQFSDLLYC